MPKKSNRESCDENKLKIDKELAFKFLLEQFRQCYIHARHYQNATFATIKFSLAFFSAVATIFLAIYTNVFPIALCPQNREYFIYLLASIALIFGFFLSAIVLQIRKNFSRNSKQIVEIRKFLQGKWEVEYPNLFGYTKFLEKDPAASDAIRWNSIHVWFIFFLALLNSFVVGFLFFRLLRIMQTNIHVLLVVIVLVLSFAGQIVFAWRYLTDGTRKRKGENLDKEN